MQIINSINEKINDSTVVCIGSFDGVHIAHQQIISKVISDAKEKGCKSMVITFKQHPLSVINEGKNQKSLLMRIEDKIDIIKSMGVDILALYDFNEIATITHKDFVSKLCENYNVREIVCGFNFRFGKDNKGDVNYLKQNSSSFEVKIFDPMTFSHTKISSTKIRELIENGEVEKSKDLLGRLFSISGVVIKGKQLGRKIGFPTANINYNKEYITPQNGVYATLTEFRGVLYSSMTNIGYNPTFKNEYISIETNLFDFLGDMYGEVIKISFVKKLRDEIPFPNVDKLIEQLKNDKKISYQFTKKYLK